MRQAPALPQPRPLALTTGAVLAAAVAGVGVAGGLPVLGFVPPVALVGAAVALGLIPVALRRWEPALAFFFGWLVVEDLVRKLAGNDLRVYFVKDLVYIVTLLGFVADRRVRGAWREATGTARLWLYALVAWALVMSVPAALEDWRLPLIGLRLDFMYAPLAAAGFALASRPARARAWLVGLGLLGGAASAVGIVQAILGPGFLAPAAPTPGLGNLVLVRGLPGAAPVYRPTGTFVDPGRFASMAVVALAVCLAALLVTRRHRAVVGAATLAAAGAVWVSGGRGGVVVGAFLVALAGVAAPFALRRPAVGKAFTAACAGLLAVVLLALVFPGLFESRLAWYRATLDPRAPTNEWASRWRAYQGDTLRGIALGGLLGQGTGRESLGQQYLYGGEDPSSTGLYQVEGGYAATAVEWGLVGLALWVGWSLVWTRRQWRAVQRARATPLAAAGLVVFGWMLFFLFFGFFGGLQGFQNYLANAYFWLLSGVLFALPQAAEDERGRA